ncbi:MAG: hypothetical protein OXD45_07250 [Rhodobacteraceae bacterium]|nr:hypothetical protein [Paracoccaceae bacterium]
MKIPSNYSAPHQSSFISVMNASQCNGTVYANGILWVMASCGRPVIPRQSGKILSRRRNRPDDGAADRSLHAAVVPRISLLHLLHPEIQFRDVVRGGNRRVAGEQEDDIAMVPQAQQRIAALAPPTPSPTMRS